jgi:hypothetical protein
MIGIGEQGQIPSLAFYLKCLVTRLGYSPRCELRSPRPQL